MEYRQSVPARLVHKPSYNTPPCSFSICLLNRRTLRTLSYKTEEPVSLRLRIPVTHCHMAKNELDYAQLFIAVTY